MDDDDYDYDDRGGATPKFLSGPKRRQRQTLLVNKAIDKQILRIISKNALISQEVAFLFYTLEISN